MAHNKLTFASPELAKALEEYPENAEIAGLAAALATMEGQNVEESLVRAIKAEYSHFSSLRPGIDAMRPSALPLSVYFNQLGKLRSATPASK